MVAETFSSYVTTVTADSNWSSGQYSILFNVDANEAPATRKVKPESALEWLDRRVDEMRVAL